MPNVITTPSIQHSTGTREEWLAARLELLKAEKELTKQSDAVRLLCAIAKDGGDPSMTPEQAKEWLVESAR